MLMMSKVQKEKIKKLNRNIESKLLNQKLKAAQMIKKSNY